MVLEEEAQDRSSFTGAPSAQSSIGSPIVLDLPDVCVCGRERLRDRETGRQGDRDRDREREGQRQRQRKRWGGTGELAQS